jgi:alkanesulfonate monooxygenase SsuD/methylene tetrahydromethanopterin reductase-like flavin-dependent oxidoreductase (luciferase family)
VSRLQLGLGVRARRTQDLVAMTEAAVEVGFDHLWVYDSGRCVEAVTALAYAGLTQPRLVVGTAVTNTETREPAVLANALATLSNLTGGRVMCGIGLGDSAVSFLGRRPARLTDFADKLERIRALLHGETVSYNGRPYRLPEPPLQPPLLLVSAEGPRTCQLAATAADGAVLSLGASPPLLQHLIQELRSAAARAGRDPAALYICSWVQAAMARDRDAALAILRPQTGRTLLAALKHAPPDILQAALPELDGEGKRRIDELARCQHLEFDLAEELARLLGPEAFAEFTVVGTAAECRARVGDLLAVDGLSELAINVYGTGQPKSSVQEFMAEVLQPALDDRAATPGVKTA